MRIYSNVSGLMALGVVALVFPLLAQDTHPSCNKCSGTYISAGEIQAQRKASAGQLCQRSTGSRGGCR